MFKFYMKAHIDNCKENPAVKERRRQEMEHKRQEMEHKRQEKLQQKVQRKQQKMERKQQQSPVVQLPQQRLKPQPQQSASQPKLEQVSQLKSMEIDQAIAQMNE